MRYFCEYRYSNGCYVAVHNLVDIQLHENIIVLNCVHLINENYKIIPIRLEMDKICYLKITPIKEDKNYEKRN